MKMELTAEIIKQAKAITESFEPHELLDLLTRKYGLVKEEYKANSEVKFNILTTSDHYIKKNIKTKKNDLSFEGKLFNNKVSESSTFDNQLPIAS